MSNQGAPNWPNKVPLVGQPALTGSTITPGGRRLTCPGSGRTAPSRLLGKKGLINCPHIDKSPPDTSSTEGGHQIGRVVGHSVRCCNPSTSLLYGKLPGLVPITESPCPTRTALHDVVQTSNDRCSTGRMHNCPRGDVKPHPHIHRLNIARDPLRQRKPSPIAQDFCTLGFDIGHMV